MHGTRSAPLPAAFPFSKAGDRFLLTLRLVDEFGFLQAEALRGFEPALQVAQFVHPAALVRRARPHFAQRSDQCDVAIGDDEFESCAA